jgi:ribonuclease BN (tRNA processing enzyme)
VQTGEAAILLDLGCGALGKLQLTTSFSELDAIVVSHMHADHFFDLVPLRYGLKYGEKPLAQRLPLWLPPGGRETLESLRRVIGRDDNLDFFEGVFAIREYGAAEPVTIRGVRLRFCATRHYVEAFSIRADFDGRSLAYSADTAPSEAVAEHARDSALFLCEASLGLGMEEGERGHLSASEAGEMARRANAGRLVLTHYPAAARPAELIEAARERFAGPVECAVDGAELTV